MYILYFSLGTNKLFFSFLLPRNLKIGVYIPVVRKTCFVVLCIAKIIIKDLFVLSVIYKIEYLHALQALGHH
jgi:hypothetical protein